MKRALVLSGGGSRGAYQFGVWKALRKLGIKIDIVTGTSIGALNGAMIVQNDYKKVKFLWENLNISNVLDKEMNFENNDFKLFIEYFKAFIKEGGMEVSALESLVKSNINLDKFYKSKTNFGLVTFKLNTLTPVLFKKEDIEKEMLSEYLIASATCYPVFKKKKIGNDVYIDGGYYDNLPINLAIDMSADEEIAVDVNMLGLNKRDKRYKNIKYIKPTTKLGNFLVFNKEEAKRQIIIGYNDTFKKYNKLLGNEYTFKKSTIQLFNLFYCKKYNQNIINNVLPKTKIGGILKTHIYNKENKAIEIMEYLAKTYELDVPKTYNIFTFNSILLKTFNNISKENNVFDIKMLKPKNLIKYIYDLITKNKIADLTKIALIFPKEYMAAMYLYTIKKQ